MNHFVFFIPTSHFGHFTSLIQLIAQGLMKDGTTCLEVWQQLLLRNYTFGVADVIVIPDPQF